MLLRIVFSLWYPRMDHFIHLLEFRIIICKKCKYAVLPSYIDAHFATKLHKLCLKEQQSIAVKVVEIDGLISNKDTLKTCEFTFPLATSTPILGLAILKANGF
jgi:hypothetical protein